MTWKAFNLLRFGHPIGRSNRSDNLFQSLNTDRYLGQDVDICMGNEQNLRKDDIGEKNGEVFRQTEAVHSQRSD